MRSQGESGLSMLGNSWRLVGLVAMLIMLERSTRMVLKKRDEPAPNSFLETVESH
jgi:hypothetical protein